jgi:uncharacterized sulfatase
MTTPNLLLITSDQQHWMTLGRRNPKIQTPHLDRLADRGIDFTRGYCPNPTCTPTRASLITGQYPSTHGAFTLGTKLRDNAPTLGDLLRPHGYRSTLVGKAHFQPLASTEDSPSVESYPTLRDPDFWQNFNDTHTPWYGFDHVELTRNHTDEGHVGQHYGLWLEERGVTNYREYFHLGNDGVNVSGSDGSLAPPLGENAGVGLRDDMCWKLPEEHHYTAWTGQRTIAAIEQAHADGTPFFIWSSYHDPHPPYAVPEPWFSMYDPGDMEIGEFVEGEMDDMPPPHRMTRQPPGETDFESYNADGLTNHGYHSHRGMSPTQLREAQAVYYGMISFMDAWIGKTLDALDRLGLTEQTLIVFTSDHGHYLGQHGLTAKGPFHYEDGIRVPLLAAWPGRLPAGRTSDAVQSLVDLPATFAAAATGSVPAWMQGLDQLPAWSRPQPGSARDHAIVENHHQSGPEVHLRTLVTQSHKLTIYRGRDWGELFDLEADPGELRNLYHDPAAAPVRAQMYEKLAQAELAREWAPMPRVSQA